MPRIRPLLEIIGRFFPYDILMAFKRAGYVSLGMVLSDLIKSALLIGKGR
jgi:hypothetical protein